MVKITKRPYRDGEPVFPGGASVTHILRRVSEAAEPKEQEESSSQRPRENDVQNTE